MRVDVSRPLDLTLPIASDDVVQLYAPWSTASDDVLPGNVDVSAVGERPPTSSVPIDVVEPSSGPAPLMRVDDMGQQRLGRPTSVDVVSYPGLPSAGVDVVRQPHSFVLTLCTRRPWVLMLLGL